MVGSEDAKKEENLKLQKTDIVNCSIKKETWKWSKPALTDLHPNGKGIYHT